MKKFLYISLGVLVVLIVGIIIISNTQNKVEIVNPTQLDGHFKKNETFLLVVGESTCPNCKNYKAGTLKEYVNESDSLPVYMFYVDTNFSSTDDETMFMVQHGIPNVQNVPATFLVKNGEVQQSPLVGNQTLDNLKQFLASLA